MVTSLLSSFSFFFSLRVSSSRNIKRKTNEELVNEILSIYNLIIERTKTKAYLEVEIFFPDSFSHALQISSQVENVHIECCRSYLIFFFFSYTLFLSLLDHYNLFYLKILSLNKQQQQQRKKEKIAKLIIFHSFYSVVSLKLSLSSSSFGKPLALKARCACHSLILRIISAIVWLWYLNFQVTDLSIVVTKCSKFIKVHQQKS